MAQTDQSISAPTLTDDDLVVMYRNMVLARAIDQRMWTMNRQGRGPFAISCQGHEAAQVATAFALKPGRDWVIPYYRDLGVALTLGISVQDVLLAFCAKPKDPFGGGRQLPNHYSNRPLRIVSASSCVGTQITHAAGIALAARIKKERGVVAVYFGEGATSTGDFHAGLNLAAIHKLPVIFIAENNGLALSVPTDMQMNLPHVADRARGYGICGVVVDGTDVQAVYRTMARAVQRGLDGEGPTLIDAEVLRLLPHSADDDDSQYLPAGYKEAFKGRDPIDRLASLLVENGWDQQREDQLDQEVRQQVDRAVMYAESCAEPDPSELGRHVLAEPRTAEPTP